MFTTVEIAEVTGGKLLGGSVTVTGVSTDTRTIAPGMLFVATPPRSLCPSPINAPARSTRRCCAPALTYPELRKNK